MLGDSAPVNDRYFIWGHGAHFPQHHQHVELVRNADFQAQPQT